MTKDNVIQVCGALSSDKRLKVLEWLADPGRHFPPQRDGDLVEDGVCAVFLAEKRGVAQPTVSRHMKVLLDAGMVHAKPQRGWTFYRLDRDGMKEASDAIGAVLGGTSSWR
jgi:DNA-binding transcriptional ArsR family regulator